MTIDPQVMRFVDLLGPVLLAAVGALLTASLGIISAIAKYAWNRHQERMAAMAEALTKLAQGIQTNEEKMCGEHKKIWDTVQGLRAEVQLSNRNTDAVKAGLFKVEGALDNHRATLYQHVERLGRIDSKLEAIFKFVDAPRRATDSGG